MIFAKVATRLETKELVDVLLVEVRFVTVANVAKRDEMNELVDVLLVVEAFVVVRLVVVAFVTDALVAKRLVVVNPVDEALPNDDVPDTSVENVPVVNDGLEESAMVLVEEKVMLAPATRTERGLL